MEASPKMTQKQATHHKDKGRNSVAKPYKNNHSRFERRNILPHIHTKLGLNHEDQEVEDNDDQQNIHQDELRQVEQVYEDEGEWNNGQKDVRK